MLILLGSLRQLEICYPTVARNTQRIVQGMGFAPPKGLVSAFWDGVVSLALWLLAMVAVTAPTCVVELGVV